MMWRIFLLAVLLLSASGCTYVATLSSNFAEQLDEWERQDEYGKALEALSYVRKTHPDYRRLMERRTVIQHRAYLYEQHIITQGDEHIRKGNWSAALATYDIALKKLPDSKALQTGQTNLLKLQHQRLAELETDLLVARGTSLLELLPVYAKIAETNPIDWSSQRQFSSARNDAVSIAGELTRRGKDALDNNDIATAQRTLRLALLLNPTPAAKRANRDLLQRLAPTATGTSRSGATKLPDESSELLMQQYRKAFARKDWVEAKRLVALLELQPTEPDGLGEIRHELNVAVAAAARHHLDKGVNLYSQGEYEKALASWHQALQLEPDNERINAHIARVERVLQKLRDLQAKNTEN